MFSAEQKPEKGETHRLRKWGNTSCARTCNEVPALDSLIPRSCGLGMRLTTKLQLQNMEDEMFTKYLSCADARAHKNGWLEEEHVTT